MLLSARLDEVDTQILQELQRNARLPFAELARRVGLSTPSVIERVRRLEETGVITGYHAAIDPAKIGLPVRAFIKVSLSGDKLNNFAALTLQIPEIIECHRVTGSESYIAQVAVEDMSHLEAVIDSMMPYVATNTSMILATPVPRRSIVPGIVPRLPAKRNSRAIKKGGPKNR